MAEFQFPMHLAAAAGDTEGVKRLIELGMSMDSQDKKGKTIVHWATINGKRSAGEEFVNDHKCDGCNHQCAKAFYTPLLISAMLRRKDVVDLLLRCGASVSLSGKDGVVFASFLHWASGKGWVDVVRRVIERGEDVIEATDDEEQTPLLWAVCCGKKDATAFLIQAGANVNHRDINKKTALHWLCIYGYSEVFQILLEAEGLVLNPQDCIGETPLHQACRHGEVEFVEKLLAAGADPSIKNIWGETAFSAGIRKEMLTPKEIRLFFQNGVFFEDCDYAKILENSDLKEHVLKDVDICTQSIMNKFHYKELPALYCNPGFAKNLPRFSALKLSSQAIRDIENFVELDIRTNMFCDVPKARPIVLKVMCVKSLIATAAPIFKK